jgi:predicted translin family RNA/ssDNA-binding protein
LNISGKCKRTSNTIARRLQNNFDSQIFCSSSFVLTFSSCARSDDEYLGGCIGLAQDLSKYAIGWAIGRDKKSVELARTLTDDLMANLLLLDFRNGPLRRKYDGLKYALKKLESIIYEISVTDNASKEEAVEEPSTKKVKFANKSEGAEDMKIEGSSDFNEIQLRMENFDAKREAVIKRCRDSQKAAKQAIFALHRGDYAKAEKLIVECEDIALELDAIVTENPRLRYGSYTNSLEEYAEAKLFEVWLKEKRVIEFNEMQAKIKVSAVEYVGGLCDLTGEVRKVLSEEGEEEEETCTYIATAMMTSFPCFMNY